MIVNLKDPASIAAWYRVHPQRHGPQLAAFAKLRPQFSEAIKEAGRLVRLSAKSVGADGAKARKTVVQKAP